MGDQDPWVDDDQPEAKEPEQEETKEEEPEDKAEEPKEEKKKPYRPKGMPDDEEWDLVDIDDPKVQKRLNRLYAGLKYHERTSKEAAQAAGKLAKDNTDLKKRIAELETRFDKKNKEDTFKDIDARIKDLTSQRKVALEQGNDDLVLELTDSILEAKQEKKANVDTKETKKDTEEEDPKDEGIHVTPEIQSTVNDWSLETDDKGNFIRPWAANKNNPHNKMMVHMASGLLEGALDEVGEDGEINVTELLEELDAGMRRYLGESKPRRKPAESVETVGGGKKQQHNLSPEQARVARMMFPNEKDPLKAYREALDEE